MSDLKVLKQALTDLVEFYDVYDGLVYDVSSDLRHNYQPAGVAFYMDRFEEIFDIIGEFIND